MDRLDPADEARFFAAADHAARFFMGTSNIHHALERLIRVLEEQGLPYAIVGAMALGEHGYRRTTDDIDVLLTQEALDAFKAANLGRGYVERFPGSRGLRDTQHDVPIDVVVAGDYPGDGKPKPVRFPDPAEAAQQGARVSLLPLERLVELKLASGMTAPHRLRDLADVLELIRARHLPPSFAEGLDPYVRPKYAELWQAAQVPDEG
jgi:hypothetical protein